MLSNLHTQVFVGKGIGMINLTRSALLCWITVTLLLCVSTILTCLSMSNNPRTGARVKDVSLQIVDILTITSWITCAVIVLLCVLFMAVGPSVQKPTTTPSSLLRRY